MASSLRKRRRAVRAAVDGDVYAMLHAPRYAELLALLDDYVQADSRVLDIGRSRLTGLIKDTFGVAVDSLGFAKNGPTAEGTNYWYDLNLAQHEDKWRRDIPAYDVVVMAEVIEHLYTAPLLVLRFLRTIVADGGVLVVQTPNATALHKRAKMLVGRHPFEKIREDITNPGHFREYTRRELESVAREAGFDVERWMAKSYFDYRYVAALHGTPDNHKLRAAGTLLNAAYVAVPPRLRPGQTLVLRKG